MRKLTEKEILESSNEIGLQMTNIINKINKQYVNHHYFNYIGIRGDDRRFEKGEEIGNSYEWTDDGRSEESLNGTCAIDLGYIGEDLELNISDFDLTMYGENVYIIIGRFESYGQDEEEVILSGAEVFDTI